MSMENSDIALQAIQELTEDSRIEKAAMTLYSQIESLQQQLSEAEKARDEVQVLWNEAVNTPLHDHPDVKRLVDATIEYLELPEGSDLLYVHSRMLSAIEAIKGEQK